MNAGWLYLIGFVPAVVFITVFVRVVQEPTLREATELGVALTFAWPVVVPPMLLFAVGYSVILAALKVGVWAGRRAEAVFERAAQP